MVADPPHPMPWDRKVCFRSWNFKSFTWQRLVAKTPYFYYLVCACTLALLKHDTRLPMPNTPTFDTFLFSVKTIVKRAKDFIYEDFSAKLSSYRDRSHLPLKIRPLAVMSSHSQR